MIEVNHFRNHFQYFSFFLETIISLFVYSLILAIKEQKQNQKILDDEIC